MLDLPAAIRGARGPLSPRGTRHAHSAAPADDIVSVVVPFISAFS